MLGARVIAITLTGAKAEPLKGAQVSVREAAADLEATRPLYASFERTAAKGRGDDLAVRVPIIVSPSIVIVTSAMR